MLVESIEFVDKNAAMTDAEEMLLIAHICESARDPKKKGVDYSRF